MLPKGTLALGNICIAYPASSKKRALEQAARLLAAGSDAPEAEEIFEHLLERERLGSTGLAGGVALPHARIDGIEHSRGAFLRLAEPVEFDALDDQPVDLLFALLVPENATEQHLQLLARLAEMLNDAAVRDQLRGADAEEAMLILTGKSSTHAA